MTIMKYDEAVEYLYGIPKFVGKTTAGNTLKLLKLLGNPQEGLKIFHVAGSNGKGSVCAFLNSILLNAGFHTGLFTSPHLVKPNERIKIDGRDIGDDEFLEAFTEVYDTVNDNERDGLVHPSFFEFIFLMCMIAFRRHNVKYAVVEVGLGGRLDATNVLDSSVVSVITSLSLEHTEILGSTLEQIAGEKAGIIKENVPVVYDLPQSGAKHVIEEKVAERHCQTYPISSENIQIIKKTDKYIDFSMNTVYYDNVKFTVPFPAEYQTVNAALAATAVAAARHRDKDFSQITDDDIAYGIRNTRWECRMEHIRTDGIKGDIYIDGAHNVSGIERFIEAAGDLKTEGKRYLLFGVVKEKSFDRMIAMLTESIPWDMVYVTELDTPRSAAADELRHIFEEHGMMRVRSFSEAAQAFDSAAAGMEAGDRLYIAGSLYLAGEIKKIIV